MSSYLFKNASEALPQLLKTILAEGTTVESRNGSTKELLMTQITLQEPIPAPLTTQGRRVSLPAQIAETMWLLAGRNDVEWLSNYLPRAVDFSDNGKTWRGGYGPRIRNFGGTTFFPNRDGIDQLKHVVELLRHNPDTRRAALSIYDPVIDTAPGKDIPCNNWVHFIARDGVLDGHVAIRSNDIFWGWSGINTFEWASILHIVAVLTGMETGSITYSISSLHLYDRHEKRAAEIVAEYEEAGGVGNFPVRTPRFAPQEADRSIAGLDRLVERWFQIEAKIRESGSSRSAILSTIDSFPEPMMRSWLHVLFAWWTNDILSLAQAYSGTALFYTAAASPSRKTAGEVSSSEVPPRGPVVVAGGFSEYVSNLHAEKHKAYGDSWKKRGEMLGIMANLARKIDRLGGAGGAGETLADTAIDLMVYAIKYRLWLCDTVSAPRMGYLPQTGDLTSDADHVTSVVAFMGDRDTQEGVKTSALIDDMRGLFDGSLEPAVVGKDETRWKLVNELIEDAHTVAFRLWNQEQWKAGNAKRAFTGYAGE